MRENSNRGSGNWPPSHTTQETTMLTLKAAAEFLAMLVFLAACLSPLLL